MIAIVFLNTKKNADIIAKNLDSVAYCVTTLHSEMSQEKREISLKGFRTKRNNVSWNSILSGFFLDAKYSKVLSLIYSSGKEKNEVDEINFVNILPLCKYFVHPK